MKKVIPLLIVLLSAHGLFAGEKPLIGPIIESDAPELTQQHFAPPVAVSHVKAQYPFALRRAEISGSAVVECVIDTQGKVHQARVVKATHDAFGESAVESLLKWKFKPGTVDGVPVNVRIRTPFSFSLNRR